MVTVKVEQRHIDEGVMQSCSNCPVALALQELYPESTVAVGSDNVNIYLGDGVYSYSLDDYTQLFIEEFDFHGASLSGCEPFEFTLPDTDLHGHPTPQPLVKGE